MGLFYIFIGILPIVAFVVGVKLAQGRSTLPRADRKELEAKRDLIDQLASSAAEHSVLGDHFAVIVTGMITDHRKALRKQSPH